MYLPVTTTSIYAVLLAILFLALCFRVMSERRRAHVSFGEGASETLRRRIRAQANFVEYAPITLILMALLELQGAGSFMLNLIGLLLLAGRGTHALGLGSVPEQRLLRIIGIALTILAIVLAVIALLAIAIFG
ncbi:MAPEG family protein [Dongia soli]|uniref:MAPEG family protein n=1 Tax=Dongia soli TaxID=600628 RepID=A0ABU5E5T0_9PROT|nr:MAPEG family protein [Dongia soli]MDY0881404.1 MAPEG family protein [Dongia soli]